MDDLSQIAAILYIIFLSVCDISKQNLTVAGRADKDNPEHDTMSCDPLTLLPAQTNFRRCPILNLNILTLNILNLSTQGQKHSKP